MKLFHASKHQFAVIKRQQVEHPEAEAFAVPDSELQNKIYLTPSLGFALAMAAGPDGMTSVVDDTISFERADQFDPDRLVYVYEVDGGVIDPVLIEHIDADQVAVDLDELTPTAVHTHRAADVFDHYTQVDWQHPNDK